MQTFSKLHLVGLIVLIVLFVTVFIWGFLWNTGKNVVGDNTGAAHLRGRSAGARQRTGDSVDNGYVYYIVNTGTADEIMQYQINDTLPLLEGGGIGSKMAPVSISDPSHAIKHVYVDNSEMAGLCMALLRNNGVNYYVDIYTLSPGPEPTATRKVKSAVFSYNFDSMVMMNGWVFGCKTTGSGSALYAFAANAPDGSAIVQFTNKSIGSIMQLGRQKNDLWFVQNIGGDTYLRIRQQTMYTSAITSSTSSTITLRDASGFSVPSSGWLVGSGTGGNIVKVTFSSKSGNTITLPNDESITAGLYEHAIMEIGDDESITGTLTDIFAGGQNLGGPVGVTSSSIYVSDMGGLRSLQLSDLTTSSSVHTFGGTCYGIASFRNGTTERSFVIANDTFGGVNKMYEVEDSHTASPTVVDNSPTGSTAVSIAGYSSNSGTSSGDPEVTTLYGHYYKLPVDDKIYRYFDTGDTFDSGASARRVWVNVKMIMEDGESYQDKVHIHWLDNNGTHKSASWHWADPTKPPTSFSDPHEVFTKSDTGDLSVKFTHAACGKITLASSYARGIDISIEKHSPDLKGYIVREFPSKHWISSLDDKCVTDA